MRLRIMSDLHLEFKDFKHEVDKQEKDTVLVLAGDVFPVCGYDEPEYAYVFDFFKRMTDRYRHVVYVFGNHEFYGGNFDLEHERFKRFVRYDNLTVLEKSDLVLDDVAFVGATLFTDFYKADPVAMWNCRRIMQDYKYVDQNLVDDFHGNETGKLDPERVLAYHYDARKYLMETVRKHKDAGRKTVMVTHHGVSEFSLDPRYLYGRRSEVNPGYVSDLVEDMVNAGVDYALHGHTHSPHAYTLCDRVRVICNPRGYGEENPKFDENYTISI